MTENALWEPVQSLLMVDVDLVDLGIGTWLLSKTSRKQIAQLAEASARV